MFGGDDFFSEIERAFFGEGSRRSGVRSSSRSNVSRDENSFVSNLSADFDCVENGGDYFVTVNFIDIVHDSDLHLAIEDNFNDGSESGGFFGGGDKVLSISNASKTNSFLKVRIPKKIAKRKYTYTLNNGILEVRFRK
jgi:HSP20 family molecular chaperone IbpA